MDFGIFQGCGTNPPQICKDHCIPLDQLFILFYYTFYINCSRLGFGMSLPREQLRKGDMKRRDEEEKSRKLDHELTKSEFSNEYFH